MTSPTLPQIVENQWQPIETAPSDWLLLWTQKGWHLGFRLSTGEWHIEGDDPGTPTHWMKLPAPPEEVRLRRGDVNTELDVGRVGKPTGLSQVEPLSAQGLEPTAFDPSRKGVQ